MHLIPSIEKKSLFWIVSGCIERVARAAQGEECGPFVIIYRTRKYFRFYGLLYGSLWVA